MARRRKLSKAQRAEVLARDEECCYLCGQKIEGPFEVEHPVPFALGGADDITNWRAAHPACHSQKTKSDVTRIAKAKRVHKKHTGQFRAPRAVIPGSKSTRFKKKLNGAVEMRPKEKV